VERLRLTLWEAGEQTAAAHHLVRSAIPAPRARLPHPLRQASGCRPGRVILLGRDLGAIWARSGGFGSGYHGNSHPSGVAGAVGVTIQGVNGLDSGCRCGRSEPWSPEPRKRAGTKNKRRASARVRCLNTSDVRPVSALQAGTRASSRRAYPSAAPADRRGHQVGYGAVLLPVAAAPSTIHHRLRSEKAH